MTQKCEACQLNRRQLDADGLCRSCFKQSPPGQDGAEWKSVKTATKVQTKA